MGIGPGPLCNFNSLDLNDLTAPSNPEELAELVAYLTAVSKEIYVKGEVQPSDFTNVVIGGNRITNANNLAKIIKQDNTSTANGPMSCNQFNEIEQ